MMENGSFHTSEILDSNEKLEELIKSIPLPNQLPKGVSFKDIPASALKSSTLESLISQNEDLMARLTVTLRKANQFEEQAGIAAKEKSVLSAKFETLREQFMVLQEKDRFATARGQQLLEENGTTKEHMQRLEKVYSDLFVQAQSFQRRMQQLERYRARVQKIAPSLQERSRRLDTILGEFTETKKSMATSHTQTVNSYEAKLADIHNELDALRTKARERDQIYEDKVHLQNELVQEQRINQNYRAETQPMLENLNRETADLRVQLKETLLAQEAERQQLADLSLQTITLKEENLGLRDQVESLQALWSHKQRELDQFEDKNAGLQKLNQSLSMNLNQQRKDLQTLQTEMDSERFTAQDKIKTLNTEIEMLRAQLKNSSVASTMAEAAAGSEL